MERVIDLDQVTIDPVIAGLVPKWFARECRFIPFTQTNGCAFVACADLDLKDRIEQIMLWALGYQEVRYFLAPLDQIHNMIEQFCPDDSPFEVQKVELDLPGTFLEDSADPAYEDYLLDAIAKLINLILTQAIINGAQKILLEGIPGETCQVEYKIHGRWEAIMRPPGFLLRALLRRLRYMSDLKVESKTNQTSHFAIITDGKIRLGFHISFRSDQVTKKEQAVLTILSRSQLKQRHLYLVKG